MEQKYSSAPPAPSAGRSRGRPRAYDPDTALTRATHRFWATGPAATSLDQLGEATGMNRPSLAAAFGDKRALYLRALDAYAVRSLAQVRRLLDDAPTLGAALAGLYAAALDSYTHGLDTYADATAGGIRGCFALSTALADAGTDADVRRGLAALLDGVEAALAARFTRARGHGELPAHADPAALAGVANALLHSLAVRARAGAGRDTLWTVARNGVALLTGTPPP